MFGGIHQQTQTTHPLEGWAASSVSPPSSVSAAAPPPPPPLPSSHRKVSLNSPASSLFTKTSKIPLSSARFLSPLTTSLRNAPIRLASGLKENKESRVSPIKADKPNRRG